MFKVDDGPYPRRESLSAPISVMSIDRMSLCDHSIPDQGLEARPRPNRGIEGGMRILGDILQKHPCDFDSVHGVHWDTNNTIHPHQQWLRQPTGTG